MVRRLEKTSVQLAKHRNHLKFNLRCKDEEVIPPSLRLQTTGKSEKSKGIISRAEKAVVERKD